MRNTFKVLLFVVSVLFFVSPAMAWHIQYTNSSGFEGNIDLYDDDDHFSVEGGNELMGDAGWEIISATEDGITGEIHVEYNQWWHEDYAQDYADVTFMIVSDFGNTTPTTIDVRAEAFARAETWHSLDGMDYGLDVILDSDVTAYSNFSSGVSVYAGTDEDSEDSFSEIVSIDTYTEYYVNTSIELGMIFDVMDLPPDTFASQAEYDSFFQGEDHGVVDGWTYGELEFVFGIESIEVPLPSTILLLAGGAAIAFRKKKA